MVGKTQSKKKSKKKNNRSESSNRGKRNDKTESTATEKEKETKYISKHQSKYQHFNKKEHRRIIKDGEYNTRITIKRVYGFNIDYNKNAYYNAINLLQQESYNVVKAKNRNLQFHNLCPDDIKLPTGTRLVLGLGLKFCIERPRPYQDIDTALMKLKRDIDIWYHLNKDVNDSNNDDSNGSNNNNNNNNITDDQ